jgi:hypothetical protein
MVRKLGELPKFLVFNSGTKSFAASSVLLSAHITYLRVCSTPC